MEQNMPQVVHRQLDHKTNAAAGMPSHRECSSSCDVLLICRPWLIALLPHEREGYSLSEFTGKPQLRPSACNAAVGAHQ
eukprot:CAMPEP_0182839484 /NCGR_PEP_ID=MMETSP0006_2-20121128/23888_1 /TAXON_ID=97485 /ORGANISM="Prymnesium parvum, Strain Texoma1" /LENGTH=78 /DNA_ID=CAMNT_0024968631 /DNA_START=1242 /DNA_END=1478 /DNA_ORIENTATION=+